VRFRDALYGAAFAATAILSTSLAFGQATDTTAVPAAPPPPAASAAAVLPKSALPAGTPVLVMTNQELSTKTNKVGGWFQVTVLNDVTDGGAIVIPKGTTGFGQVTFATNNGGFGKPGILSISLRYLELNGSKVLLDGRYREEGANKNGATAATWFAVGIFAGCVRGKPGVIPMGRELKARTGEDIAFVARNQPRTATVAPEPVETKPAAPVAPPAGR
jgi:hypothetical protein